MDVVTLLSANRIAFESEISSKKRAFERLAELLQDQRNGFDYEAIFDALVAREKLGSTALGNGIAIPHACLPNITEPRAALLVIEEGLKLDAPDKQPVGVLLALLVPEGEDKHHRLLGKIAAGLNHKALYSHLVQLKDPQLIFNDLQGLFIQDLAA